MLCTPKSARSRIATSDFLPRFALVAGDAGDEGLGFCGRDMNSMADSREVMNIRQASQYLGVSPDTLYKYVNEQKIPAFKLGNRWRFKKSKLDQWMEEKSNQMEIRPKRKPKAAAAMKAAGAQ
jgi:excisionase family DNA binding protein